MKVIATTAINDEKMLDQETIQEIDEFVDGVKTTDNFLQVAIDVEKYVNQAVELFHSAGQDDKKEIADHLRKGLI